MEKIDLNLPDATIHYYPKFLATDDANTIFEQLLQETPWQEDFITVFGKTYPQPRLTALYANNNKAYSYSSVTMNPHLFTTTLQFLQNRLKLILPIDFTTCLLNLYRNGKDSNGWHADNEKELGTNPVIASVSLGASRMFQMKHRFQKEIKSKLVLENGSLLLMRGTTQHYWLHQIPKTTKVVGPRINLTFRVIR